MKLAPRSFVLFAFAGVLGACNSPTPTPPPTYMGYLDYQEVPECDPSITIQKEGPALLINDPVALKGITLEKVMNRLLEDMGYPNATGNALELAQRLFDGSNNVDAGVYSDSYHCDSLSNPAHVNGPAAFCPRSEGALAASKGLFLPGHKDHFVPVAVVNRFDLTPLTAETCGEARIVFAKESGRTDPNDRVFLIFEASIPNPRFGDLGGCRGVARFWEGLQAEKDAAAIGDRINTFFFVGNQNQGRPPLISINNLGFGLSSGASYYGGGGQIRISQHMDDHWELRQVVAAMTDSGTPSFDPVPVGNNPMTRLFGNPDSASLDYEQSDFAARFAGTNVDSLAQKSVTHIRSTYMSNDLSGESALGGDPINDYVAAASHNVDLREAIKQRIAQLQLDCPADDPMTTDSILRRATMDSCAGCHAPSQFLGPDRKIGCGAVWPDSLGEVHIDEAGKLSPALTDVFLPHRAAVLETFLKACEAPEDALNTDDGASTKKLFRGQTLGGGSTTH